MTGKRRSGQEPIRHFVRDCLQLMPVADRRRYVLVLVAQMVTGLLDLVGVVMIGLVGALAVAGIQESDTLPSVAQWVVERLKPGDMTASTFTIVLAASAAVFLIGKSLLSAALIRAMLTFLSRKQAQVSGILVDRMLRRQLADVEAQSTPETAYAVTIGAAYATTISLGAVSVALADVVLLAVLTGSLLLIDPALTIATIVYFTLVALIIQRIVGTTASRSGALLGDANVRSAEEVQVALHAFREVFVGNRRSLYRDRITDLVSTASRAEADVQFVAQVPKFVFETALVLGALALALSTVNSDDPAASAGILALFLAAGTRVMPSLLRLQVANVTVRSCRGRARPTLDLARELASVPPSTSDFPSERFLEAVRSGHPGFVARVCVDDVSYTYPGSSTPALTGISFEIPPGATVAVVGSTGSGKSTLADLLLGLLDSSSGDVLIGGLGPAEAISRWPGAIGYVPQVVSLRDGTVRHNVAHGLPPSCIDDRLIWECLERAQLAQFLAARREGLDTIVGERGVRLSGGQRQRLGLARALYSRPRLLVLDEATSSLDAQTEAEVTEALEQLPDDVTRVAIAHRLATVRSASLVLVLDSGRLSAAGTFDDVRAAVPRFDQQVRLLGP